MSKPRLKFEGGTHHLQAWVEDYRLFDRRELRDGANAIKRFAGAIVGSNHGPRGKFNQIWELASALIDELEDYPKNPCPTPKELTIDGHTYVLKDEG